MTDIDDDLTLLTPAEVVGLQRQIEAGVLARAAREAGSGWAGATEIELLLLEEQGERARQRFIRPISGWSGWWPGRSRFAATCPRRTCSRRAASA